MGVVIVGAGKVGEYLASTLLESGNEVSIIESDPRTASRISAALQGRNLVICGDGCDSKYQEDAGIRKADVFVASTGQDDNNLVACEIAQRVFGVSRCIARVNNPRNMKIFTTLGIESISSTTMIVKLIEEEALLGSVGAVTSLAQGKVVFEEVTIPHMKHHSNEKGVLVSELPLPSDCLVVAVSDGEDAQIATPSTPLYPGDKVVVAIDRDVVHSARNCFRTL